jgi:class 3 adenylate cyclase
VAAVAGPPSQAHGFLFADLRDYSRVAETRGDHAAAELLGAYRTLVREEVERYSGAEIRTEGDSFYIVFSSASAAIRCGLAILDAARVATEQEPSRPIRVGIGVHAGETAETAEGLVGSAVNIAARVCAQAKAGELLVTDIVRGLTRTSSPFGFVPIGARRLKGIAEPVTLYRVLPEGTAVTQRRGGPLLSGLANRLAGPALAGVVVVIIVAAGLLGVAALGIPGASNGPSPSPGQGSAGNSPPAAGTRIIFSRQVPLGDDPARTGCDGATDAKLYVLDPEHPDAPAYRLTSGTDLYEQRPWWAANGSRISFVADVQNQGPRGLFVTTPAGATPVAAVERAPGGSFGFFPGYPRISADGSSVAWADGEQLWLAGVDGSAGSAAHAIAGTAPPEEPGRPEPSLPPEATKPPEEPPPAEPTPDLTRFEWMQSADWLPDGRILALTATEPAEVIRFRLESMKPDGSDRQPLGVDLSAFEFVERIEAAADGQRAALETHRLDGSMPSISIADLPSGAPRLVAGTDEQAGWAAWAPDGASLVYTSRNQLAVLDV